MNHWVVDASVALKWYLPEDDSEKAKAFYKYAMSNGAIAAPDFLLIEFTNSLWTHIKKGRLRKEQAIDILNEFREIALTRLAAQEISSSALDIAEAINCSIYDAAYLAAAEILDCPLVTADAKLFNCCAQSAFASRVRLLSSWESMKY